MASTPEQILNAFATRVASNVTPAEFNADTVAIVDAERPEMTDRRLHAQVVPQAMTLPDSRNLLAIAEISIDLVIFLRSHLDRPSAMSSVISSNAGATLVSLLNTMGDAMRGSYLSSTLLTPLELRTVSSPTAAPVESGMGMVRGSLTFAARAELDWSSDVLANDGLTPEVS